MADYKVTFFKQEKEADKEKPGKFNVTKTNYLGTVIVDDNGDLTIAAKAFRRCSEICTLADKITIEVLR